MAIVPVTHQVNTNTGYLHTSIGSWYYHIFPIFFFPNKYFNFFFNISIYPKCKIILPCQSCTYQGTNDVMTPNTNMVTELTQMATLRPYLSDTRPEQKEPRAKPVKRSILARVLSQLLSHTRSHSVTMVDTQNS